MTNPAAVRAHEWPITVLGMGHVGIPTALGLAKLGWNVTGVDCDGAKIASLKEARAPFYEPGLQELLSEELRTGRFAASADLAGAIRSATVLFICVGTPQRENGEPDLSQIEAVAREIARNLNGYKLIVEKSTVPAITAHWMKKTIERHAVEARRASGPQPPSRESSKNPPLSFDVASNPEFLRQGTALHDFFHPDRIVCGVETERAWAILSSLYASLQCPILRTDLATAELIKHAANAFLATKISFINTVADLCEHVGADIEKVVEGIGLDRRIGPDFLRPGIGFGGYCLPKDLRAFIHLAEQQVVDVSLLRAVERTNECRVQHFLEKLRAVVPGLRGKTIAILGLAYKPETDDIRGAPALRIIETLLAEGASVRCYDPRAMPNVQLLLGAQEGKMYYAASPDDAATGAEALLLLTEWQEFRRLDLQRLGASMQTPVLLDGRNVWNPTEASAAGLKYVSLGRP